MDGPEWHNYPPWPSPEDRRRIDATIWPYRHRASRMQPQPTARRSFPASRFGGRQLGQRPRRWLATDPTLRFACVGRQRRESMQTDAKRERNGLPRQLVQQVPSGQSQFRITGQRQPSLEEQRVGIFQATREEHEFQGIALDGRFGLRLATAMVDAAIAYGEDPPNSKIVDLNGQSPVDKEIELARSKWRLKDALDDHLDESLLPWVGNEAQRNREHTRWRQQREEAISKA